ncbi:MAG: PrgI family protein [Chloroflexota bacterium]|nr:PrgI family protein [Chloroflexota bacterium]
MEPVKVPQNLELQDVVAFGLGALDLLCVIAGATLSWWLYLALPGDPLPRAMVVAPIALAGLGCGVVRLGDLALREWSLVALRYAVRPRLLVVD